VIKCHKICAGIQLYCAFNKDIALESSKSLQIQTKETQKASRRLNHTFCRALLVCLQQGFGPAKGASGKRQKVLFLYGPSQHAACLETGPRHGFLNQAPTQCLQQSLKDLERAFINYGEKRSEFPRFHKRGRQDISQFPSPQQFKVDEEHFCSKLPKMDWVRYYNSRPITGEPKNITASLSIGIEADGGIYALDKQKAMSPILSLSLSLSANPWWALTWAWSDWRHYPRALSHNL
jgi:hypothetical protein